MKIHLFIAGLLTLNNASKRVKEEKTDEQIPLNQNDQNFNQNPTLINFNNLKRSEIETFANEKNFEAIH